MPHVTLLYGSLLVGLVGVLGMNVTRLRVALHISVSSEPPPKPLLFAIRAHGNAAEWTPMLVVMLLLVELGGGTALWLHVAGGALLLARVLHATGLLTRVKTTVPGVVLTWSLALWLPVWGLVLHFTR
jgi:uncharacterized protein